MVAFSLKATTIHSSIFVLTIRKISANESGWYKCYGFSHLFWLCEGTDIQNKLGKACEKSFPHFRRTYFPLLKSRTRARISEKSGRFCGSSSQHLSTSAIAPAGCSSSNACWCGRNGLSPPWMICSIISKVNEIRRILYGSCHDDVSKWKHFLHCWPFVRGIHWSLVDSPHKACNAGLWFFFHLSLNKRPIKQPICWWFEMPWCSF